MYVCARMRRTDSSGGAHVYNLFLLKNYCILYAAKIYYQFPENVKPRQNVKMFARVYLCVFICRMATVADFLICLVDTKNFHSFII